MRYNVTERKYRYADRNTGDVPHSCRGHGPGVGGAQDAGTSVALHAHGRRQDRSRWRVGLVASGLVVGLIGAVAPIGRAAAAPAAAPGAAQVAVLGLAQAGRAVGSSGDSAARRHELAVAVAVAADVDPAAVDAAWAAADRTQVAVALTALSQIGAPYRRLGSGPTEGFDCSGFTSWAWASAGVELPHSSWGQLGAAGHVAAEAQLGDLVGYSGHVMLYLGGGVVIHSPTSGRTVAVEPLRRHVDHFVSPVVPDEPAVRHAFVMTRVRVF